jgi:hydrogenase-4 component F
MDARWYSMDFLVQCTLYISLGLTSVALLARLFFGRKELAGRWVGRLTVIGSATLFIISFFMMFSAPESEPVEFKISLLGIVNLGFYIDALSVFFILIVNTIAFAASWNSLAYLKGTLPESFLQEPTTFHLLVNIFHLTMLLVPMINNLIGVWIAIELTTLGSALLMAYRGKRTSWEATWKYLMITSIGIIVALLGTMFLANAIPAEIIPKAEQDQVMNWTFLKDNASQLTPSFVWLAFVFALVGYGTKAGLAPMHTWLPDGHGEAPSPISALLSGVLLKSALYAILRFYTLTNLVLHENVKTSTVLLGAGLLSLLVATPLILKENPFKRVLAYHSLEHMGIITFAIGLGAPIALFGALLHMLNHAITKAFMFLTFGNVIKQYEKQGIAQKQITGIFRSMPLTGGILALGGLALVGTPPFNIFISEFIILWGAFSGFSQKDPSEKMVVIIAVTLFIISTTLIFYGLVAHLGKLVLHKAQDDPKLEIIGWAETMPLVFLFVLMFVLGLWIYPPLANLINASVKIILPNYQ